MFHGARIQPGRLYRFLADEDFSAFGLGGEPGGQVGSTSQHGDLVDALVGADRSHISRPGMDAYSDRYPRTVWIRMAGDMEKFLGGMQGDFRVILPRKARDEDSADLVTHEPIDHRHMIDQDFAGRLVKPLNEFFKLNGPNSFRKRG